ncbi:AAA family ATPase [Brevundimonas sp.]|uniref:AAA family ATPase n=1 Tax=Brevundimonas sp. TaxID=1871086 RepID=UPI002CEE3E19|nr:AAA family ATPase [Brevundimonas sp.]HWQ85412.1 AAA family ATPase [Brevundimonas sp.]
MAGPNGSGKSTIYSMLSAEEPSGSIWIINPDELSKRIADQEALPLNPDANLEAVKRIEAWLRASIRAHQTIGVETVLSTPKYRDVVAEARRYGFAVRMIFVFLDEVDLNVERVAIRVEKGGHSVPEDKIRDRRRRSFEQFGWFLKEADRVEAYDNSGADPRLVLSKHGDELWIEDDLIPELADAVSGAYPEWASLIDGDG